MKISRLFLTFTLAFAILIAQVGTVLAAPSLQEGSITGNVTELVCDTDTTTGTVTFLVTVESNGTSQTVRIDQQTAVDLGLITVDESDVADCSEEALAAAVGVEVSIDPATVIPDEEEEQVAKHPVGAALAIFFGEVTDYDAIMAAHEDGFGFGVIAQALWLTKKMEGDAETLSAILLAKETGDYSAFVLEDGSSPANWGQFRKAVLNGDKQNNLGVVMSDKEDKGNNGNPGQGVGNGNNNGKGNGNNGQGQGNSNKNKDKDKGNGN